VSRIKPAGSTLDALGGEVGKEPELSKVSVSALDTSDNKYNILYPIFVKGIAGIVAERIKIIKPRDTSHLVFDERGRFAKKQVVN